MNEYGFNKEIEELLSEDEWLICQNKYEPLSNSRYETILTLTNGYMGTRGSLEEGAENERPGNYISGLFDRANASAKELVNTPKWIGFNVYLDGNKINADTCKIIDFKRILDMRKGMLIRKTILRDSAGKETCIESLRFLSRNNVHLAGSKIYVTPMNHYSTIRIESILDGTVTNLQEIPEKEIRHLSIEKKGRLHDSGCYIETATIDKGIHIGIGTALHLCGDEKSLIADRGIATNASSISEYMELRSIEGKCIGVEKYAVVFTSRECEEAMLESRTGYELSNYLNTGFFKELREHIKAYEALWENADVRIEGDKEADKGLRFNIFHLMSCVNQYDTGVSIGAKALHGEGYRGHVFWDTEIFMLPLFIYSNPEAAKALLMYRYDLLDAARKNAVKNGYQGAQYPWESADSGEEETPQWAIDFSGETIPVMTAALEHHISADIAYSVIQYHRATGDRDFMLDCGIEMLVETARFWTSRCSLNEAESRYEILNVIGPDEFHEEIDNNFYTNYLVKWTLNQTVEIIRCFEENCADGINVLKGDLKLADGEVENWKHISGRLYIPYHENSKLIEQFTGYFGKTDYKISQYDSNNMPIWPEGANLTRLGDTQLVKQADVILLLALLGEEFDEETIRENYNYYDCRTMHKSSLSPAIYALIGLKTGDISKAYQYFVRTISTDLTDNQNNTDKGFHAAAAGGAWQVAVFGFGGIGISREGILVINPQIPPQWDGISFKMFWRGNMLKVCISKNQTNVRIVNGMHRKLPVMLNGKYLEITNECT